MTGADFERLILLTLQSQGYAVMHLGRAGDLGVDIIAEREGVRTAVQCKRQCRPVDRKAISDVVTGRVHHRCQCAMVITNQSFTPDAYKLAASTECRLVDGAILADMLAVQPSERSASCEGGRT